MLRFSTFCLWQDRVAVLVAFGDRWCMVRPLSQGHVYRVPTAALLPWA
jgi:hypothetical protein